MIFLFTFAVLSSALAFALSLGELNPFGAKPLPMLEQIELYRAQVKHGVSGTNELQLAA